MRWGEGEVCVFVRIRGGMGGSHEVILKFQQVLRRNVKLKLKMEVMSWEAGDVRRRETGKVLTERHRKNEASGK